MIYGIFETKGREGKMIGYHVPCLIKMYGSRDWRRIYGSLGLRKWPRIFGIYRWFVTSEEDYIVLDVDAIPATNIRLIGDFWELSRTAAQLKKNHRNCTYCKHFNYDGEYWSDAEQDFFEDISCEKGHYDKVGFGAQPCKDFE